VEVALHRAPAINGDFVRHDLAKAVDHRTADLIFRAARIDDGAADVAGNPNLIDL